MRQADEKLIAALLSFPTVKQAAESVGMSDATAWRKMKEPAFEAAYRLARRKALQQSISLLQKGSAVAVTTLITVCQDKETPSSARVSAANSILSHAMKAVEIEELEERLSSLETLMQTQEIMSK